MPGLMPNPAGLCLGVLWGWGIALGTEATLRKVIVQRTSSPAKTVRSCHLTNTRMSLAPAMVCCARRGTSPISDRDEVRTGAVLLLHRGCAESRLRIGAAGHGSWRSRAVLDEELGSWESRCRVVVAEEVSLMAMAVVVSSRCHVHRVGRSRGTKVRRSWRWRSPSSTCRLRTFAARGPTLHVSVSSPSGT